MTELKEASSKPQKNIFGILKNYKLLVVLLVVLTVATGALNLVLPRLISHAIDQYTSGTLDVTLVLLQFGAISLVIFVGMYLQSLIQTYASEKVARDIRTELTLKISEQNYLYIQEITPSKLLTNLTSDADAVKQFVSQAIVSMISSVFIIIGASVLLLSLNWKLGLAVLAIIPLIGITFFLVFSRMGPLFKKAQEIIDSLNKVINESILGAALIRVLNSQNREYEKFVDVNTTAKNTSMQILKLFSAVIPIVTLIASLSGVVVLVLGGKFVIEGTMTLGEFAAFNAYIAMLIFPIIMLGFMSTIIGRASASYGRISAVTDAPTLHDTGTITANLSGTISVENLDVQLDKKPVLKQVSFTISPHSKTAIIGPTAAGKTQLLYALTGLLKPASGDIVFDATHLDDYEKTSFYSQVGFVFQDSIMFNMSLKENIAFNTTVQEEDLQKALETAELDDFIKTLPDGLNTLVSERGTSLSGGQKQRVMLARALALNPRILLLDDFTARVDASTEQKILANISKNYPDITLISVTQKIASVEHYDQIIVLMEGEVLATGTHTELMKISPEYVQIYNSQQSTNQYELHT